MSRIIHSFDGLAWWQHHILSRRQDGPSEATSTSPDANTATQDNTRMHLYIALGAAIGILILIGVFCAIVLIKRRRRLDIQELETGHVDSEEDVRFGQGVMAGKPIIFLVPPHGQIPLPAMNQRNLLDDPEKEMNILSSNPAPRRPAKKTANILKRISERYSTAGDVGEAESNPTASLDADPENTGQLRFPPFEEEVRFAHNATNRARPMTTPRARHVRGVSSRTFFNFMPEGAVFNSIPRAFRNSQVEGDRPPSLPPLGQVSPFHVPQLRRGLTMKRSGSLRTRLSFNSGGNVNAPILRPNRRSFFGSADFYRISKHDRTISMRSDLSTQRSTPSTIKARPRSKESRSAAVKSRASTRPTVSRSNSDVGTFRTGSAASSELPESSWNRFSVHRIETANQISIKRLSGTGPLIGAVKSVQRITGPIKRLQPKVIVTANGSPVDRKRSSVIKRLSLVRAQMEGSPNTATPPRRRTPSTQLLYRSVDHSVSPITPPRKAYQHRTSQGNPQQAQKSTTAIAGSGNDQGAAMKAAQISNISIGIATTTRQPVAYPAPVAFTQDGAEDPFFLDRTIYSPRSGASPRSGGRRKRSSGKQSPVSPQSTDSTPMRYACSRVMHGIKEEVESDNEGEVSPAVTVTQIHSSPLPRATPTSGAWLAASPTLPTAAARATYNSPAVDHRSMSARAASVTSRQSMRSSVSRLSIPEFPSTPSRFHAGPGSVVSEPDPLPAHAYSDPSTLSSARDNGSSVASSSPPVPTTSNSTSTLPSSPLDLPSSPPIIARSLPVLPIQSPKAAYRLSKLSKDDEELIPLTATSQPGPLLPRTAMEKPKKSRSSPRKAVATEDSNKPRRTRPTKGEAEIDAMRRRITHALDGYGSTTASPSTVPAAQDEGRAHDSGHEELDGGEHHREDFDAYDEADDDDSIWEAPKLPELDFDPAPLFTNSPAASQLHARRMHRTPRR